MNILTVAESLGEGIISVPETLWYGVVRTEKDLNVFEYQQWKETWAENLRLLSLLKDIVVDVRYLKWDNPLCRAVAVILEEYYKTLPDCAIRNLMQKVNNNAEYLILEKTAYFVTSYYLLNRLVKHIAKKVASKICSTAASTYLVENIATEAAIILNIQGLIEKSGRGSERLKNKYPTIYQKMKKNDLDMLYFIIEKPMDSFLRATRIYLSNRMMYHQVAREVYCT